MGKTVRATSPGFYGGVRRRVGEVFEVSDGKKLGKWMELVKETKAAPKVKTIGAPPKLQTGASLMTQSAASSADDTSSDDLVS